MNIGEFFVTLGVDAETVKVKDFVKSIGELPVKAAAGIAALAGISLSIHHMAGDAMDAALAFQAFEAQTGLSSQQLQRWQIVARQANVSAESVTSSVTSLQRQLADIRMGRGNVSPFQILGIDPRQDAFKVIDQLRQRVKGMDRGTATNLISQMGLTPDMMQVLTLSDEKFKEFASTVTGMTPKEVQNFQRLKLELTKLNLAIHDIFFKTMGAILPILIPVVHNVLPLFARTVEHLVNAFMQLSGWLGQFQSTLPMLGTALLAVGLIFAPVTAGVGALLLILEDLYVWSKGGKSLFGAASEALKTLFDDPLAAARTFLDLLNEIVATIKGFIGLGDKEHADLGKKVMENFKEASGIGKLAQLTAAQALVPAAVAAGPGLLGITGMHNLMSGKGLFGGLFGGKRNPAEMVAPAVAPGPGESTGPAMVQTNNVDINIASTAPAVDVAKATKKEFDRDVNAAALQTDNGGY